MSSGKIRLALDRAEVPGEAVAQAGGEARRQPAQQRSRERVGVILSTAAALIAERGSDQVKMSEVAALAGISIGSLYQYFPHKSAIIRALAEQYHAQSQSCVAGALAEVRTAADLRAAFAGLLDQYYQLFLAEPVMRDIWSGTQADKQLVALELAQSRISSAMLAAAMRRVHPRAEPHRIEVAALLLWQLGEATMRLAISVGRAEGDAVVDAFKRMALRQIADP